MKHLGMNGEKFSGRLWYFDHFVGDGLFVRLLLLEMHAGCTAVSVCSSGFLKHDQ